MADKITIEGLDQLNRLFAGLPEEVSASVIRNISRRPANKVISVARHLIPQNTGHTAKSVGILSVKDKRQRFVEVGFKGKSLGYIFLTGAQNRRRKSGAGTGSVKKYPNFFHRAADIVGRTVLREMNVDISRTLAKGMKKYGAR